MRKLVALASSAVVLVVPACALGTTAKSRTFAEGSSITQSLTYNRGTVTYTATVYDRKGFNAVCAETGPAQRQAGFTNPAGSQHGKCWDPRDSSVFRKKVTIRITFKASPALIHRYKTHQIFWHGWVYGGYIDLT